MTYCLLMFEDDSKRASLFERNLKAKALVNNNDVFVKVCLNADSLGEILRTNGYHIALVDNDLSNGLYGNDVIEDILEAFDENPEYKDFPIIYYSSNSEITHLREKAVSFGEKVNCVLYHELEREVLNFMLRY